MQDQRFELYPRVPDEIRDMALLIMKRFTIGGCCDGMYIANTIAYIDGTGDGKGNFSSGKITNAESIALDLQKSYGCNIFPEDIPELTRMLQTGKLDTAAAVPGIERYIDWCRNNARTSTDGMRKKYNLKNLFIAKRTLELILKGDLK